MKVLKQSNQSIQVELSPLELLTLHKAMIKESRVRKKIWSDLDTKYPEELLYHLTLKDTSEGLKAITGSLVHEYKKRGILK